MDFEGEEEGGQGSKISKKNSPLTLAISLGLVNYFWFLILTRILLFMGLDQKTSAAFSFIIWLLTLPATFWVIYYFLIQKYAKKKEE